MTVDFVLVAALLGAVAALVRVGSLYVELRRKLSDPVVLRAQADSIEAQLCTGLAASWCPIHGDCTCPRDEDIDVAPCLNDLSCPLHGPMSTHAVAGSAKVRYFTPW